MVIAWIALHNWCAQSYIMYQLSTCEMCLKKIIQVGSSNHLRAKRKETPVGQCWCHGWTCMNHVYPSFSFLFFNLKSILTARMPLGSQLPKVRKDLNVRCGKTHYRSPARKRMWWFAKLWNQIFNWKLCKDNLPNVETDKYHCEI